MDRLVNLDSKKVKQFYKKICKIYSVEIVQKEDSILMQGLNLIIPKLTSIEKNEFLNRYSTTIYNKIYIPYEVGNKSDMPLDQQIHTLIHELTHVKQFNASELMPLLYLIDVPYRALKEAEAWSANIEFKYWRYGATYNPDFKGYANKFLNYDGDSKDCLVIQTALESDFEMIKQGISVSQIVDVAIDELTKLKCWSK